jgi:hypothetical protein
MLNGYRDTSPTRPMATRLTLMQNSKHINSQHLSRGGLQSRQNEQLSTTQ